MSIASLLLCASACHRSASPVDYYSRIGLAVRLPDRVCMAIQNSKLLPSATITLIAPSTTPHTARAQVLTTRADACPGTQGGNGDVSYYDLAVTSGTVEQSVGMVALDARLPSVGEAHSFHSCTGADAVLLTAWDGAKPLEGNRLWGEMSRFGPVRGVTCSRAELAP